MPAQRILCLSAEAADICARLGAWDRVVGVTAFASQAGLSPKPVISGFSHCDCERALRLDPDLVLLFSDVQAEIAASFIRRGCAVLVTNQRTLAGIADAIRLIGGAIGYTERADEVATSFLSELASLQPASDVPPTRPRVYFEEWPEPFTCGIGWVSELIELAGGLDIFSHLRHPAARDRAVSPEAIIAAAPDLILASWCGRPVDLPSIRSRPGFDQIPAVRHGQIHALDSNTLLQPGPGILTGARQIRALIDRWKESSSIAD